MMAFRGVDYSEYNVRFVTDVLQRRRRDLNHQEVAQEIRGSSQSGTLCSDLKRQDLRRVHPHAAYLALGKQASKAKTKKTASIAAPALLMATQTASRLAPRTFQ